MEWTTASHGTTQAYTLQNSSTSTDGSCNMFTAKQLQDMTIIIVVLSFCAVAMCLVSVIVILALRQFHTFVHRLVLYMMIVSLLNGLATGLESIPVHHTGKGVVMRNGFEDVCVAVGLAVQLTLSQFMLILTWILGYLFLLVVCKYPASSKKHEITGLVITLGLPLLVDWLPFMHNLYGQAGAWCWIRITNADCSRLIVEGVVYQLLLFYGPQVILLLLSFVVFVIVAVTLAIQSCKRSRDGAHYQISPNQQAIKEAVPLLLYPILYNVIVGVMFANRINYAISVAHDHNPYYPLFLAHAVCDPLHALFLPLAFLLHPGTVRKLLGRDRPKKRSEDSETNYRVPTESITDVDPLIIRGRADIYAGGRYKSLFDVDP